MTNPPAGIRWLRIVTAGLAVIAVSFLVLIVLTTADAFGLAFQARGAPDQKEIGQFAAAIGMRWLPWIEVVSTFAVTAVLARKARGFSFLQGFLIGIFSAALYLAIPLAFGAHLGLRHAAFAVLGAGAGCLGALLLKTVRLEKREDA
jgi:hypothetical protein